ETGEPVLVPPVRPAPCVVVREVLPGVAIGTVVLANGAPRTLGDVCAPALPVGQALRLFDQTAMLGRRPLARAHITPRSCVVCHGSHPTRRRYGQQKGHNRTSGSRDEKLLAPLFARKVRRPS